MVVMGNPQEQFEAFVAPFLRAATRRRCEKNQQLRQNLHTDCTGFAQPANEEARITWRSMKVGQSSARRLWPHRTHAENAAISRHQPPLALDWPAPIFFTLSPTDFRPLSPIITDNHR
jgi:hypothetical protein